MAGPGPSESESESVSEPEYAGPALAGGGSNDSESLRDWRAHPGDPPRLSRAGPGVRITARGRDRAVPCHGQYGRARRSRSGMAGLRGSPSHLAAAVTAAAESGPGPLAQDAGVPTSSRPGRPESSWRRHSRIRCATASVVHSRSPPGVRSPCGCGGAPAGVVGCQGPPALARADQLRQGTLCFSAALPVRAGHTDGPRGPGRPQRRADSTARAGARRQPEPVMARQARAPAGDEPPRVRARPRRSRRLAAQAPMRAALRGGELAPRRSAAPCARDPSVAMRAGGRDNRRTRIRRLRVGSAQAAGRTGSESARGGDTCGAISTVTRRRPGPVRHGGLGSVPRPGDGRPRGAAAAARAPTTLRLAGGRLAGRAGPGTLRWPRKF
jgi:hypothetical protein